MSVPHPPASDAPTVPWRRLPVSAQRLARLHVVMVVIFTTLFVLSLAVPIVLLADPWMLVPVVVLAAGLVLLDARRQLRRARRFRYRITGQVVEVRAPGLVTVRHFIPRTRILHVEEHTGPLARRLGLTRVDLLTAGTVSARTSIGPLAPREAAVIIEALGVQR